MWILPWCMPWKNPCISVAHCREKAAMRKLNPTLLNPYRCRNVIRNPKPTKIITWTSWKPKTQSQLAVFLFFSLTFSLFYIFNSLIIDCNWSLICFSWYWYLAAPFRPNLHYGYAEPNINPCVLLCVEPFIHPFYFFCHNYTVAKQLAIDLGTNEDGMAPVGKLSHISLTLTPLWQPINKSGL